jgi:hypothetical protein
MDGCSAGRFFLVIIPASRPFDLESDLLEGCELEHHDLNQEQPARIFGSQPGDGLLNAGFRVRVLDRCCRAPARASHASVHSDNDVKLLVFGGWPV